VNIRIILFKAACLIAGCADAFKGLPKNLGDSAANQLNGYRSNVNPEASDMLKITYNHEFQVDLDSFIKVKGVNWFFDVCPNVPVVRQGLCGYYLMDETIPGSSGTFKQKYPGFAFGWHDTCKKLGDACLSTNLKFRYKQKDCIKVTNCNLSVYDRFMSCLSSPLIAGPSLPCSFVYNYLPLFLYDKMSSISAAVLDRPGFSPPSNQKNSYWLYANFSAPQTDQIYKIGKSDCKNRLCM